MNHTECQSLLASLSEYVDGELSPEMCEVLEQHLAGCSNCRVVVNTMRKTIELYHAEDTEESVPGEVRQRLFRRLDLQDLLEGQDPGIAGSAETVATVDPEIEFGCSAQGGYHAGDVCPRCKNGILDYDAQLNLHCSTCDWKEVGAFT